MAGGALSATNKPYNLRVKSKLQLVLPQQVDAVHPEIVQPVRGREAEHNSRQLSRGKSGHLLLQCQAQHLRESPGRACLCTSAAMATARRRLSLCSCSPANSCSSRGLLLQS